MDNYVINCLKYFFVLKWTDSMFVKHFNSESFASLENKFVKNYKEKTLTNVEKKLSKQKVQLKEQQTEP